MGIRSSFGAGRSQIAVWTQADSCCRVSSPAAKAAAAAGGGQIPPFLSWRQAAQEDPCDDGLTAPHPPAPSGRLSGWAGAALEHWLIVSRW